MCLKNPDKKTQTGFGILRGTSLSEGEMSWSKVETSSIGFAYGEANSYQVNSLDNNKLALDEYVGWLVNRGWVVEEKDISASGEGVVYWAITKQYVTIDGGTREYAFWIEYTGSLSTYDSLNIYGYDKVTGTKSSNDIVSYRYDDELHGIWTMWASDQDSDSYLIINQTTGDVIGFMPPSGSLFNYASGFGTHMPVQKGFLPLFAGEPAFDGTSAYTLSVGYGYSSAPSSLVAPVPYKFDYVVGHVSSNNPLFAVNGGDMSSMLALELGAQVQDNGEPVTTLLLDGEYYIAWGEKSQILFNVGTNAPVY